MGADGREFEWDDTIENDGKDFEPLPEGDYSFTIDKIERGRSKGEGKLPPCNMAIVYFIIHGADRDVEIRENYVLHSSLEWKLSELFRGIGLKKKGEQLRMNWNLVPGSTGRCQVTQGPGLKNPEQKFNRIKKVYDKEEGAKFTPGRF